MPFFFDDFGRPFAFASLIALKRNYLEFILIANSPLTITSRNFAKLYALARISPYMDPNKLRILMRSFITSQFQYCPLVWMFHNRQLNQKINKIHERALRITYKDTESTFSDLLQRDCAVTIHTKNLQMLMTEMYKTRNDLNPSFMQEIFCENMTHYNLRNNNEFIQPRVRSVNNGSESVRFVANVTTNNTQFRIPLSV